MAVGQVRNPTATQNGFAVVGNICFERKLNATAGNSAASHLETFLNSSGGTFRWLKMGEQFPKLINEALLLANRPASPALDAFSKLCSKGWTAMGFGRVITANIHAYKGQKAAISDPECLVPAQALTDGQKGRLLVESLDKKAEGIAMAGYTASMLASCSEVTAKAVLPLKQLGDVMTLTHDACDLGTSVQDLASATRAEKALIQEGEAVNSDVVSSFRETKVNAALRVAKAALAVFGGILGVGIMLGVIKVASIVLVSLGIVTSILAFSIAINRQAMKEEPIKMAMGFTRTMPATATTA